MEKILVLTFASSVGGGETAKLQQLPDLELSLGVPILRVLRLLCFLEYNMYVYDNP